MIPAALVELVAIAAVVAPSEDYMRLQGSWRRSSRALISSRKQQQKKTKTKKKKKKKKKHAQRRLWQQHREAA
jgi:hypothetical protein